jgi:hypothetical protein
MDVASTSKTACSSGPPLLLPDFACLDGGGCDNLKESKASTLDPLDVLLLMDDEYDEVDNPEKLFFFPSQSDLTLHDDL